MAPSIPTPVMTPDIDRGSQLISIYSSQCGISLIFLSLRLWARIHIRGMGWDDTFMVITWLLFACLTVIVGFIGANGGTRHVYFLGASEVEYVVKLNYIAQPFGIVSVGTGKIAVGLTILRLLGSTSKWRKRGLWVLIILTGVITIVTAIFTFTQCKVPAALWQPSLRPTASCYDPSIQSNFSIFSASWNSAIDFILALLPGTFIWRLHLTVRKRVGLIVLLGCGMLSGVCSAIKTAQLVSLAARSDLTWATYQLFAWASAEIFVIILCGSVPTLKPLWNRVFSQKRSKLTPQSFTYGQYSFEPGSSNSRFRKSKNAGHELTSFDNIMGTASAALATSTTGEPDAGNCPSNISNLPGVTSPRDGDEVIRVTRSIHLDWRNAP
ncbi:hypothetical protein F5Y13DRAFT_206546 [Hypoxylon sp. FL1857]|nr:hypothetical protein F5Y13DRAFT_206546 [Hypoxylon sp. FL1857]